MPQGHTFIVTRDENLKAHVAAYLLPRMAGATFYRFGVPTAYRDPLSQEHLDRQNLSTADGLVVALTGLDAEDREVLDLAVSTKRPLVVIMKAADPEVWRRFAQLQLDNFPPIVAVGAPNRVEAFFKEEGVSVEIWPPFDFESVASQTVDWIESRIRRQHA